MRTPLACEATTQLAARWWHTARHTRSEHWVAEYVKPHRHCSAWHPQLGDLSESAVQGLLSGQEMIDLLHRIGRCPCCLQPLRPPSPQPQPSSEFCVQGRPRTSLWCLSSWVSILFCLKRAWKVLACRVPGRPRPSWRAAWQYADQYHPLPLWWEPSSLAFEQPAQRMEGHNTSRWVSRGDSDIMRTSRRTISTMPWPDKWPTHHHIDALRNLASRCLLCSVRSVSELLERTSCSTGKGWLSWGSWRKLPNVAEEGPCKILWTFQVPNLPATHNWIA